MPFKLKIILLNFVPFNFPQESSNLHESSFFVERMKLVQRIFLVSIELLNCAASLGYCLFFKAVM